ncbi:unnamed protein product [Cuscuta epithymum]|uniref:Reverse transcriptase Ty1/copia-type domain-containing protein n=1 Tax=Cuscuta epithymum TaxID=186058 RepID=A0AAV0CHR3_9ASTE|nr:unnamed protein product [Cuscuta epithymum]
MLQPPGFVDPNKPNHICRLRKALYGLKDRHLGRGIKNSSIFLLDLGFLNSKAAPRISLNH